MWNDYLSVTEVDLCVWWVTTNRRTEREKKERDQAHNWTDFNKLTCKHEHLFGPVGYSVGQLQTIPSWVVTQTITSPHCSSSLHVRKWCFSHVQRMKFLESVFIPSSDEKYWNRVEKKIQIFFNLLCVLDLWWETRRREQYYRQLWSRMSHEPPLTLHAYTHEIECHNVCHLHLFNCGKRCEIPRVVVSRPVPTLLLSWQTAWWRIECKRQRNRPAVH